MCTQVGAEVISLGFAAGENGKFISADLKKHGVEVDYVWVEGETRANINIISTDTNSETEILEAGPTATGRDFSEVMEKLERWIDGASVVVLSGGIPQGLECDAYAKMISKAKAKNIPTILDTNGEALKQGIKAGPTMIKPNIRELSELVGVQVENKDKIIEASKKIIIEYGVEEVVVSQGSAGATIVTKEHNGAFTVLEAKPPDIVPINTLGCGDAMVAGLACGLAGVVLGTPFENAMAFAASNALHREIGFISKVEIVELIRKINPLLKGEEYD